MDRRGESFRSGSDTKGRRAAARGHGDDDDGGRDDVRGSRKKDVEGDSGNQGLGNDAGRKNRTCTWNVAAWIPTRNDEVQDVPRQTRRGGASRTVSETRRSRSKHRNRKKSTGFPTGAQHVEAVLVPEHKHTCQSERRCNQTRIHWKTRGNDGSARCVREC